MPADTSSELFIWNKIKNTFVSVETRPILYTGILFVRNITIIASLLLLLYCFMVNSCLLLHKVTIVAFAFFSFLVLGSFPSKFPLSFRRCISYVDLCAIIGVLSYFIRSKFGFSEIHPDSARYMLSALIQSEAAILAIVVTLSLVAVQQSASSYSPRVIKIFKAKKRNPDFYILIGSYIFAMAYGVWVLTQVSGRENLIDFTNGIFFESFESHIWFAYSLGIFAFIALIFYINNTLNLLDPSKMIDVISKDIPYEFVESRIEKKDNNTSAEQILDIVNSSLVRKDCRTAIYGLETIKKSIDQIGNKDTNKKITGKKYSRLISYFEETGKTAVILGDHSATSDVIKCIKDIAINEPDVTNKGVLALKEIGVKAAEQRMNDATNEVASSLKDIGLNEIKKWKQETSSKIE